MPVFSRLPHPTALPSRSISAVRRRGNRRNPAACRTWLALRVVAAWLGLPAKASAALTARLTLSTIAFGVPAGATMPVHELAMKLGTPSSAMVGTSGRSASRFDDGVPSGRNFLSRNCGNRTSPAQINKQINNKCDQAQHPHSNPFCGAQVCRKKFHWKHVSWQDALTLFLIKIKFLKIGAFVNSGTVLTCTERARPRSRIPHPPYTPSGVGAVITYNDCRP